eukprot:CAMPEP_0176248226 /NCGR_PEP_ID=MMETSP0121_2-20121125/33359_1 /TAXON_ID=160619 /ORGANISM="Kryptoperidinium foliaceum, Strain CCMP 1326" /LENGTH=204 /DNA_ID=CAMNT_0017587901 /DNA_START=36 /DNA_END=647 /DNA_ORIENTATION=+
MAPRQPKKAVDYSQLEVGMKLQASSEGIFYAAEIVAISDSKKRAKAPVKVRFLGYTEESDEWVGGDRLRSKALKPKEGDEKEERKAPAKGRKKDKKPERTPTEFDPYLQNRVNAVTLVQYIITSTKGDKQLAMLMNAIQHACKVVSNSIEKAGPAGLYGLAGNENATGDDVKKLDIIADDIWVECLRRSGVCGLLVSEEQENAV